jgi:DNA mismatch repair protein MutS2
MPVVTDKVKKKLEWEKVIQKLAKLTQTPLGEEISQTLEPSAKANEIESKQYETGEAVEFLCRGAHVPFGGISDIRPSVDLAHRGSVLGMQALYDIGIFLASGRKVRTYLLTKGGTDYFVKLGASMPLIPKLQAELERCVFSPNELSDNASPVLELLRRELARLENRIRDHLDNMIRSTNTRKYLQEALITMRNERYVLPVKQEYRQQVPGIVHDQSASGATLFVEPLTTFELGNRLREVHTKEKQEAERILAELSYMVGQEAGLLSTLSVQLGQLDFILAKGKLALIQDASLPRISDAHYLELRQARNPLLGEDVVPVDIWLGRDFQALVITGPNTGGKTVLIKTVGLLVLMHQSGLHIPTQAGSELPIFKHVFCDIGDEQSIEQSLSTFSGHMGNIIDILQHCTADSLVLLDELGAGTDPSEGAALGMAVLEYLTEKQAMTIATTHYSELKAFAYSQPKVENASVEFDPITLQPTYRLVIGLPGRSNALEIATRLGLDQAIVTKARSFLYYADAQADALIRSLTEKRQQLDRLIADASNAKLQAEKIKMELEEQWQELLSKKGGLIRQAQEEAMLTVNHARRESERIIRNLRKKGSSLLEKERTQLAEATRAALSKVQKLVHNKSQPMEGPLLAEKPTKSDPPLEAGQPIYIPHLKVKATVIDPPNPEGDVKVQAGILKMTLPVQQIQVATAVDKKQQPPSSHTIASAKAQTISPELDFRGLTVDEALYLLDKYLDDARLAGLTWVRLIHGKGTGALRQAVHDYLNGQPGIKSFSLGSYKEGGTGVTIAHLKE